MQISLLNFTLFSFILLFILNRFVIIYTCIIKFSATVKRFYRKTGILSNGDKYEITLDQKRLKTPLGKVFEVQSKPLALAIAHEWDSQRDTVNQSIMHLVSVKNHTLLSCYIVTFNTV